MPIRINLIYNKIKKPEEIIPELQEKVEDTKEPVSLLPTEIIKPKRKYTRKVAVKKTIKKVVKKGRKKR